jgi:hypothetical protein
LPFPQGNGRYGCPGLVRDGIGGKGDSVLAVKIDDPAPSFSLPSLSGATISVSQYKGTRNVLISFNPGVWTSVYSDQWPGHNIAKGLFKPHDAIVLGIHGQTLVARVVGLLAPRRGGTALWWVAHGWNCRKGPAHHRQSRNHSAIQVSENGDAVPCFPSFETTMFQIKHSTGHHRQSHRLSQNFMPTDSPL